MKFRSRFIYLFIFGEREQFSCINSLPVILYITTSCFSLEYVHTDTKLYLQEPQNPLGWKEP